MKLIVNADDFGLCEGANYGIINAYRDGLVRSTTIMAGMPGYEHSLSLAKANPGLKIGVHLYLTSGKSLGKGYKTITDSDGNFLNQLVFMDKLAKGELDLGEIEKEYELQIKKVMDSGIVPTHFDGHHHMHMQKGVHDIFLKLAKKYNVAGRITDEVLNLPEAKGVRAPAHFDDGFYGDNATADCIKNLCKQYDSKGIIEIMCHPAFVDPYLLRNTRYNMKRVEELEILTSAELKDFIKKEKIELCSYADL